MRRLAVFFLVTSLGAATVYGQGNPETLGTNRGKMRADLAKLHRVAERAKSATQISPSRNGALGDAQQTRGNTAERLAKKLRTNQTGVAERLRSRESEGVERREPARVEQHERLANRAELNDPQRLALRQRLALIDRMRDDALAREDVEALNQADRLERRLRERFSHARGNGIPYQPLPEMNTAHNSTFMGPGYGPFTADNGRERSNEFGQQVAAMAQVRNANRQVQVPFRPGNGTDEVEGTVRADHSLNRNPTLPPPPAVQSTARRARNWNGDDTTPADSNTPGTSAGQTAPPDVK